MRLVSDRFRHWGLTLDRWFQTAELLPHTVQSAKAASNAHDGHEYMKHQNQLLRGGIAVVRATHNRVVDDRRTPDPL